MTTQVYFSPNSDIYLTIFVFCQKLIIHTYQQYILVFCMAEMWARYVRFLFQKTVVVQRTVFSSTCFEKLAVLNLLGCQLDYIFHFHQRKTQEQDMLWKRKKNNGKYKYGTKEMLTHCLYIHPPIHSRNFSLFLAHFVSQLGWPLSKVL